jgi:hypothetical protein
MLKYLFFSITIFILLFFSNCDLLRLTSFSNNYIVKKSAILFDDSSKIDISTDALNLTKASIRNDLLTLTVGYSGGCKEHEFQLFVWKGIAKSNPPRAELLLSHNGNGDLCEAYITQELKFDLTAFKLHMKKQFNYSGAVILRIYPPGSNEPFKPEPVYNFK